MYIHAKTFGIFGHVMNIVSSFKAPSIVNGSVYFNDLSGMAYALDLLDGSELWRQPGPGGTSFSTASSAVGYDQRLYNAFNMELSDSKGQLRCHELTQGDLLWSRSFALGLNVAPAIGVLKNLTVVIVALGDNPTPGEQSLRGSSVVCETPL